ncbi:DNAse I-like superfamily protein [Rhynchospora pubera]|uniref:DNAse I-like superfamily protein n=1 Tax=Rhynchospora pubera TaxID=906938 RepID=A0AAV8C216_9POAL|nr:DNAse I-like superfamily protein [Rhynchospora pubera]
MRSFTSMSSSSGFKARGRGTHAAASCQRTYSDRATGPTQNQSPLTNGAPDASSQSRTRAPNARPNGPRVPYTGYYTLPPPRPHGRGPGYSDTPFPPAPGLGYNNHRPTQFRGQGPPYTGPPQPRVNMQQYYNHQQPQLQPPQWYVPGTPNGVHRQAYAPQHKSMHRQPSAPPNKLASYRRRWRFPPSLPVPSRFERFRLLSYNILADYLAVQHSKLYSHVPLHMLSWQWRMNKLLFEFQLWSPDVLCLQEVDRFPDLQTELESKGYNGIWKIRTGNASDGCAIFWRTNRFQLLHHGYIEFRQIELKDNVAQICVLESIIEKTLENDSPSTKSSSSRVVVCNIHVLFNPKRGDIKLGQVRTLIDQALTVSKSWGDAPVVLCGDFNSTPNSPLYKFISEQKLDLSGLVRTRISGQETDNALATPPGNNKFVRSSSSIGAMNCNRENTDQSMGTSIGTLNQNTESTDQSTGPGNGACNTLSSPVCTSDPDLTENPQFTEKNNVTLSTESDATESSDLIGTAHAAEPIQEANVHIDMNPDAAQGLDDSRSDVISSNSNDPPIENFHIRGVGWSESLVKDEDSFKSDSKTTVDSTAAVARQLEETHIEKKNKTVCSDVYASQDLQESNCATTSTNFTDENSDSGQIIQAETLETGKDIINGNCLIDSTDGDNPDPNFLSELHGTQDEFGFKWTQDEFAFEANKSSEIIGGSLPPYGNDPYKWNPDELRVATGSEDCTFIEHSLKLRSVYKDVEDHDGTKGSHGEPEATCYNQNFLGTVDYIWSSEGLKTAMVLDTIPKHVLKETKGFPTKKWGSDHIALVCELAFTNG